MRNTKWVIKNTLKEKDIKINDISVDKDILKILFSRGIKSDKDIKRFLNPKLDNIRNPYDLCDMEKTVTEIEKAIKEKKNIWIYGDYDVDGITSTSILYLALKELNAENINYYIPIRDEGYGLNNEALKKIKDSGGELLITVDCGITAHSEVEYANSIGLPVIITDHHNLHGNKIPNALAVINPKRKDNKFPFEFLAGVGTIFMVILALFEKNGLKEKAYKFLDLVAIGTVADIVPLLEENRILTKFGLEKLPFSENKGLSFLLYKLFNNNPNNSDTPKSEYSTYDVGFIIAPVFNAAGRLKDAKMVVKLLISDNSREIEIIVKELINKNYERKELQNKIIDMIEKNIEKNNIDKDFVIIDHSPEYHHGVIGIAAAKIVDIYYKPVIIMEVKEDERIAIGSCRSIENFNILEALQSMAELFIKFGGHAGAAGFTIPIKNINLFRKKINDYAKKVLKEEDFVKIINIDKQIPIQKMSYEFFQIIELLKPFGFGNPSPTFQTKNVLLENIKFIGETKNHLMFDLKQKGFSNKNAVWFGAGEYFKDLSQNLFYDIVYKLKVEPFQDRYYTKVYIDDIKISSLKDDTLSYYHSLYNTSFPLKSVFYTNIDLEKDIFLTVKVEFDQISLFQGRKFVGRLDYNVSNLLILLNKYYNYNFIVKIENIKKTMTHNIIDILIKRDYTFECYEYTEMSIFRKIKEFLIGNMEYDSYTKHLLSLFFKQNYNLILLNNGDFKNILNNFLLTLGIYYMKQTGKKSRIITKDIKNFPYNGLQLKLYFDITSKYEYKVNSDYPFTFFYNSDENFEKYLDNLEKKSDSERFCIFSNNILKKNLNDKLKNYFNTEIIDINIQIPENIVFLDTVKKSEFKDLKNIYVEYLPLEEKINLKELFQKGEIIHSDKSIVEIL
ncbi:single-stranded-DNA-specific exonuclease RecJ [Leptotrichia sp. OH3620_COT-345]|uniref:single-stranded-DNA-specific exonuclease RecJ n=1 Tax=Leptotrichia sp. OH3620_COT-345 TaxID=2491048 RepID=UPI000F64A3A8|nr:single-stranded-DNA-specific exonuclease RecJ [Leptotrichia sp. OH3620_COT-345]RRD38457.1 single-stranded-DNA-specific exonuclease RecJ [Leptotrichia sp. OH3620_COT-345]